MTSTQQEWLDRVTRWQSSGLDLDAFAALEGIASKRLRWWLSNPGRLGLNAPFVNSTVTASTAHSFVQLEAPAPLEPAPWLEVVANGRVVRVPPGFDEQTLMRILSIIDGGPR